MYIKVIGSLLIVFGCGGYGAMLNRAHRQQVNALRQLRSALQSMEAELQYRMTPLPALCHLAAAQAAGALHRTFEALARELEKQNAPQVQDCMEAALEQNKELPCQCAVVLGELGRTLGRFDLPGQVQAFRGCQLECSRILENLECDQPQRMRDHQVLSFCAGAALAILLF